MPTVNFASSAHYSDFAKLCRELEQCRTIANQGAREAAVSALIPQFESLIKQIPAAERIAAAEWLWSNFTDAPPFDRVFALLTPAK